MMKYLAGLLSAVMLLCGVVCGGEAETMVNPIVEYSTLEEVNNAVGCHLAHPAVMGVEDVAYLTIDCGNFLIGEYDYKVNGRNFMLRAAKVTDVDISGIYSGGKTLFEGETLPEKGVQYSDITEDGYIAARWIRPNGYSYMPSFNNQYVLVAAEADADFAETFHAIAKETAVIVSLDWDAQMNTLYYHELVGDYEDSWSQRAVASIALNDQGSVNVTVHWSSSAWEYTEWTMTAVAQDNCSRLVYCDCICRNIVCDDKGNETVETVYENGEGWFESSVNTITNEIQLKWCGAAEEQCRKCSFVKLAK